MEITGIGQLEDHLDLKNFPHSFLNIDQSPLWQLCHRGDHIHDDYVIQI